MATPKSRTSHTRTRQRKAQWLGSLIAPSTSVCPQCGEVVQTHRACSECGYYRGRQVLKVDTKAVEKAES